MIYKNRIAFVCASLILDLLLASAPSAASEVIVEELPADTKPAQVQTSKLVGRDITNSNTLISSTPKFIACDTSALQTAITEANLAGQGTIRLASNCIYSITTPATPTEGFPVITGEIKIKGNRNTVLSRAPNTSLFRIFNVQTGAKLALENLTLYNASTDGLGGGVLNGGTLTVNHVIFSGNTAGNGGGVANSNGAEATIKKSEFTFNSTTGVGGGGILNSGTLNVSSTIFKLNFAPINGGGINTQSSGVTVVKNSKFNLNSSGSLGGALSNLGSTSVNRTSIMFNNASAGGAIATANEKVFIKSSKIKQNTPDNCNPLNTIPHCTD